MSKLGLQLYTVKDDAARDLLGTIGRAAEAGYQGVEFAGYYGHRASAVRTALDRAGIASAGGHIDLTVVRQGLEGAIEYQALLNGPAILCPWIFEPERTPDGYKRIANDFNRAGELCAAAGMRFIYHIHGYEFTPLANGRTGMDILFGECSPQVAFEADTYWIAGAGVDPANFIRLHGARCPYLHLKDMIDMTSKRDTEVGDGVVGIPSVLAAARPFAPAWLVVEQEAFDRPVWESVAISARNVRRLMTEG
jgi:sugar phosphate isomerase/epimerase